MNIRNLMLMFFLFLAFTVIQPPAKAGGGPPTDLSGTYVYQGRQRDATISKIEIRKVKGQSLVHVWFYGLPDDVDWGEVVATEYRYTPMSITPDLVATLQHNDAKAIVAIRVENGSGEDIMSISVQSWMSWTHPDEKHVNEAARDSMLRKK